MNNIGRDNERLPGDSVSGLQDRQATLSRPGSPSIRAQAAGSIAPDIGNTRAPAVGNSSAVQATVSIGGSGLPARANANPAVRPEDHGQSDRARSTKRRRVTPPPEAAEGKRRSVRIRDARLRATSVAAAQGTPIDRSSAVCDRHDSQRPVPSRGSIERAELRAAWQAKQEAARGHFGAEIRLDGPAPDFPAPDFTTGVERVTRAGNVTEAEFSRLGWVTSQLANEVFAGKSSFGANISMPNVRSIAVPAFFEFVADDLVAPQLRRFDFDLGRPGFAPSLHRLGNDIQVVSLLELRLQGSLHELGARFDAPNLTHLSLENCRNILSLPPDINIPSLTTLDLRGAPRFLGFPPGFFEGVPLLRSIELEGTQIRYEDLPEAIRNNGAIHIDIRPEQARAQDIGGLQSTHHASVHGSASASARALMVAIGDLSEFDIGGALHALNDHILALPPDDVPEGLQAHLDRPIPELLRELEALPMQHPWRQYFGSKVNAAKRAVGEGIRHLNHTDKRSSVKTSHYLAAIWEATGMEAVMTLEFLGSGVRDVPGTFRAFVRTRPSSARDIAQAG